MIWYETYLMKRAEPAGLSEEEAQAIDEFLSSGASSTKPSVTPHHIAGGSILGAMLAPALMSKLRMGSISVPKQMLAGGLLGGFAGGGLANAAGEPPSSLPQKALVGAGVGALSAPLLSALLKNRVSPGRLEGAVGGGLLGLATGLIHDYKRRHELKDKLRLSLENSRKAYGKLPVTLNVYEEA